MWIVDDPEAAVLVGQLRDEMAALRVRLDGIRGAATEMLGSFVHPTHPGYRAVQSRHVGVKEIERWRAAVWPAD